MDKLKSILESLEPGDRVTINTKDMGFMLELDQETLDKLEQERRERAKAAAKARNETVFL